MSYPNQNEATNPLSKLDELRRGWLTLLASSLGCAFSSTAILFYSMGVFISPLEKEFGWARGDVGASYSYFALPLVFIAPMYGWLVDRYGARRVASISIPCFALVLLLLSQFSGPIGQFHALFVLLAVVGGGTTPIVYCKSITGGFDRMRGLALGVTFTGIGLTALSLPYLLTKVNIEAGWRYGFLILAAIALLPLPAVLLGLRNSPKPRPTPDNNPVSESIFANDALGSRVFWIMGFGFLLVSTAVSALVVHFVPMLQDSGLTRTEAGAYASMIGVGVTLGRFFGGWIVDRYFAPYVAAILFIGATVGCFVLLNGSVSVIPLGAALVGIAFGAEADLLAYLVSRYFSATHYALLYAIVYGLFMGGTSLGPLLAGMQFDATKSYTLTLWSASAIFALGGFFMMLLPRAYPYGPDKCVEPPSH